MGSLCRPLHHVTVMIRSLMPMSGHLSHRVDWYERWVRRAAL